MDLIFEIEVLLCERFPALDPLALDEYRAVEVFKLVKNLNTYTERHANDQRSQSITGGKKKYRINVTE